MNFDQAREEMNDMDYPEPPQEPSYDVENGLKYAFVDIMELMKLFHLCIFCSALTSAVRVRSEVNEMSTNQPSRSI